jgi:2-oxoacid:acceptor oxidoreductase delta subunit (pyruvate/2-ketoisovalerate family)
MVGGIIYEPGNTKQRYKTGGWRSFRPIVDPKKCTRCKICEGFCPETAITVTDYSHVDYDFCKGCGICANVCPFKAITMVEEEK